MVFITNKIVKKNKEGQEKNDGAADDGAPAEDNVQSSDSIRKNITIRTEGELAEAVASMSADQKQAYDLIMENALHACATSLKN